MPTVHQWHLTWQALGAGTPDDAVFHGLMSCYAEPHRRYHDTRHLDHCLAMLPPLRSEASHPEEIELALWFHDAIYDPRSQDNEQRSADWARAVCLEAKLPLEVAGRIHALILATRHDVRPRGTDAQIVSDIDLSILGAAPERFDEYEQQIRQEYSWVPAQFFRRERRRILEGFLARPRLFGTEYCFNALEPLARENLRRSIKRLGG